jgi:hypothetical protein
VIKPDIDGQKRLPEPEMVDGIPVYHLYKGELTSVHVNALRRVPGFEDKLPVGVAVNHNLRQKNKNGFSLLRERRSVPVDFSKLPAKDVIFAHPRGFLATVATTEQIKGVIRASIITEDKTSTPNGEVVSTSTTKRVSSSSKRPRRKKK